MADVSEPWTPDCALCHLLNSHRANRPAVTLLCGVPLCAEHLGEAAGSDGSKAARTLREIAVNTTPR